MKTNQVKLWKKILISALALIGLGIVFVLFAVISDAVDNRKCRIEWYYQDHINDSLRADYHYPDKDYIRIYNTTRKCYVSPKMRWLSRGVSEGDSLTVFCDMNGKRGYINLHTGKVVIEGRYKHAWNFSEGLAAVCRNNLIGFINAAGEEVIPCQYPTSIHVINSLGYAFHDGYCTVTNSKNECGLINQQGQLVVDTIYDCIWSPSECGARIFQDNNKYGVMDLKGNIIVPLQYDNIWCEGERLFATKNGIMAQIDKTGKVIRPFCSSYDFEPMYLATDHDDEHPTGYFKYFAGGYQGVIDAKGRMVIPAIYHQVNQLDKNLFEAEVDYDYYDGYGAWITIQL
jgi:hypothetical protein